VSGTIEKIESVPDTSGYKKPAIIIKVEGDEWIDTIDRSPDLIKETTLSKEEIIARISEMGIVGLGGATFPSHVKMMIPTGRRLKF
jgi:electron transport complex protein RnfC